MTLIIATSQSVYGDRRVTSNTGEKCDPIKKIAANEVLAAGFAGGYHAILKAIEAVEAGESDPHALAKLKIDGIVVKQGRIYLIDAGKAWLKRKGTAFIATGTGYAEALGFLSGCTRGGKKATDKIIKAAFRYTFRVRDDCGGGVDFIAVP